MSLRDIEAAFDEYIRCLEETTEALEAVVSASQANQIELQKQSKALLKDLKEVIA